jgi:hypothetical protein
MLLGKVTIGKDVIRLEGTSLADINRDRLCQQIKNVVYACIAGAALGNAPVATAIDWTPELGYPAEPRVLGIFDVNPERFERELDDAFDKKTSKEMLGVTLESIELADAFAFAQEVVYNLFADPSVLREFILGVSSGNL